MPKREYNSAVLAGNSNNTVPPIFGSITGQISRSGGQLYASNVSSQTGKTIINSTVPFVGAHLSASKNDGLYGLWEYPLNRDLTHDGMETCDQRRAHLTALIILIVVLLTQILKM